MKRGVEGSESSVWDRGDWDVNHGCCGVVHVGRGVERQEGLHVATRTSQLFRGLVGVRWGEVG